MTKHILTGVSIGILVIVGFKERLLAAGPDSPNVHTRQLYSAYELTARSLTLLEYNLIQVNLVVLLPGVVSWDLRNDRALFWLQSFWVGDRSTHRHKGKGYQQEVVYPSLHKTSRVPKPSHM